MDDTEILTILKNAIEKIELDVSRAEYTNEIYDVELDISEAIKYINSEIK